ncbi:hypothetical protein PtB15_9B526 [Puccinia triticina]|nr:hypothetical protein PtB15_9B526 [Puccinia triticina]
MIGSTSPGTLEPDSSEVQHHQQQGDLVIQGFRNLVADYNTTIEEPPYRQTQEMPIQLINSKKAHLKRLQTELLPLLHQLFKKISDLLDPIDLRNRPGAQLKLLLEAQSKLEHTFAQLQSARGVLSRGTCPKTESSDAHLEDIKSYRLFQLDCCIHDDLWPTMCVAFKYCSNLIQLLRLSSENFQAESPTEMCFTKICLRDDWPRFRDPTDIASARTGVVNATSEIFRMIDLALRLTRGSDFYVLRYHWPTQMNWIASELFVFFQVTKEIETVMNQCPALIEAHPLVSVARSIIPTLKLSRVFLKKLSGEDPRPQFSDLTSRQLADLGESPTNFNKARVPPGVNPALPRSARAPDSDPFKSIPNNTNSDSLTILTGVALPRQLEVPQATSPILNLVAPKWHPIKSELLGVTVNPQCMHDFIDLKLKKKSKYIIYAISDDSKEIVVEKVSESTSYDTFLEDLPSGSCRYAVYDFEYALTETEGKRNKLCFFTWSPDDAKIKNKMVYAASKRALREALVGIGLEIQGTDASEVSYDTVLEKALRR